MSIDKPVDPDLKFIKNLIELNGLSISKAADMMSIQRSNLSSWLNGKPNVFSIKKIDGMLEALSMRAMSDPASGLRLCYVSPEVVHRWQVEQGAQSFIDVMRTTEPENVLDGLEIFRVDAYPKGHFNIVRGKRQNGELMLLVANRDPASKDYPLSAEMLGFGKMTGTIELPLEKWIAWRKEKTLPMPAFGTQIAEFMGSVHEDQGANSQPLDSKSQSAEAQLNDCQCQIAGLNAFTQALIDEVLRMDPGNRLLEKDEQKRIYNDARDREIQKRSTGG